MGSGVALLLTNSCILDKSTHSRIPRPQIKRLQFAPVRSLESLDYDPQRLELLRQGDISPPETVYLPTVDDEPDGDFEAAALLSQMFTVDAVRFDLELVDWSTAGIQGYDPANPRHIRANLGGDRSLTMEPHELALLHKKMSVFWTGMWPKDG
jgi:hypothetical protein